MADRHIMVTEATLPHGWMVQCPDCLYRMFFYRDGKRAKIERGDFYAWHSWSNIPELSIGASLEVSDG